MLKDVKVEAKNWEKLAKLKLKLGLRSYNEVISRIFLMIKKLNLYKELEDLR